MESVIKRCYTKSHWNKRATKHCFTCNKDFCEICAGPHSRCDRKHELYSIDTDSKNVNFTGLCKEGNHTNKLDYFCKTHNNLCCAACLCKIKEKGDGQHTECNACHIDEIKDEKKSKLNNNIKIFKNLLKNSKNMLKEIKRIYDKNKPKKDEIKENIKNIFNNFRYLLDKREKELLNELDNSFEKIFFNEEFFKNHKKIPNKIEYNLKKAKAVIEKWEEDEKSGNLNNIINDCVNIEKNLEKFLKIKEKIDLLGKNTSIQFNERNNDIELISEKIKNFGEISCYDYKYIFKQCPSDINIKRRFIISGQKKNIIEKKDPYFTWTGTTCLYELKKPFEYKWKIRIKRTETKQIMVGVVPSDFNIENIDFSDFTLNIKGWFFYCYDNRLYSGPPHNYNNKATSITNLIDEIIVVMNMNNMTLKFMINNKYKEIQYYDIPDDKPLFPAVCLFNCDEAEILEI